MAENTNVGPAGSTGPALGAKRPDNHGVGENEHGAFDQGQGQDAPDVTLHPYSGPVRNGGS